MPRKRPASRKASPEPTASISPLGAATLASATQAGGTPPSATLERFMPAGPSLPFTHSLTVVRAPGGFIVFQAGGGDEEDPHNAIGVAATPLALSVLIDDWAHKAAPAPTEA